MPSIRCRRVAFASLSFLLAVAAFPSPKESDMTGCDSGRSGSMSGPGGFGPRVAESAQMLINPYFWSAPLEEVRFKRR